jgi:hypothetical protein
MMEAELMLEYVVSLKINELPEMFVILYVFV